MTFTPNPKWVYLEKNLSNIHELPVLMYHRVVDVVPAFTKKNLHITQQNLENQLSFLKIRGFKSIGFEDLLHRPIPAKPVIMTFDDGFEDNYHFLFPLLKKYQMKAVIYLLGNRRHRKNFWFFSEKNHNLLKPSQIMEMHKSGLVEFGAHSMNHAKLTELNSKETRKEVGGSKKALETFLGKPVVSFSYPNGLLNEEIKNITAQEGYTFGIAVNSGPSRFGDDLMEIRRIRIFPRTSNFMYYMKTSGFYLRYQQLFGYEYYKKTRKLYERYRRFFCK